MASVFVITSLKDNYPTVCLEANCCGTPVVGFDVGGIKETIGKDMGEVVEPFNMDELFDKVIYWANNKENISTTMLKKRQEYCDYRRMTKDYITIYEQMMTD